MAVLFLLSTVGPVTIVPSVCWDLTMVAHAKDMEQIKGDSYIPSPPHANTVYGDVRHQVPSALDSGLLWQPECPEARLCKGGEIWSVSE